MTIRLYNTLTRQKDALQPLNPDRVTMYVCGPTVYSRSHIGNARPAVVFDVLYRLLQHTYPDRKIEYARNITDIDDRIIAESAATGVSISEITKRTEQWYLDDVGALGVIRPPIEPHATTSIPAMIAMIGTLIAKGHAYAAEGHVLFDVPSFAGYGRLSRRPMDEMIAGARVEVAPYKRNPGDFVLWKLSSAEQPGWDSPWGRGRPGWHIECSAMIAESLGTTIDIHGGGQDLQFPHHENELAQSACAHDGAPLAQIWMHNGFLNMGTVEKMSKSLGNIQTIPELLAQGWHGEVLRLALLSAHYRQPLEWTDALLRQTYTRLDRMYQLLADDFDMNAEAPVEFTAVLADDLNTPAALAWLSKSENWIEEVGSNTHPTRASLGRVRAAGQILGIFQSSYADWQNSKIKHGSIDQDEVETRIAARTAARAARNWAESDRIRDELAAAGIILEDGPGGTTWRRA